jgi:hypothetical protein
MPKKVKSGIGGGTSSAINRLPIAAFLPYTFYTPQQKISFQISHQSFTENEPKGIHSPLLSLSLAVRSFDICFYR